MRGVVAPLDLREGAELMAIDASITSLTELVPAVEIMTFLAIDLLWIGNIRLLYGLARRKTRRETDDGRLNWHLCGHKVFRCDLQARLRQWGGGHCEARRIDRHLWRRSVCWG